MIIRELVASINQKIYSYKEIKRNHVSRCMVAIVIFWRDGIPWYFNHSNAGLVTAFRHVHVKTHVSRQNIFKPTNWLAGNTFSPSVNAGSSFTDMV